MWIDQKRQWSMINVMGQLYFVILAYLLIQGIKYWFPGPTRFRKLLLIWYVWSALPLFLFGWWGGRYAHIVLLGYTPLAPFWPTYEVVAYVLICCWGFIFELQRSLLKFPFPQTGLVILGFVVYLIGVVMDHWNITGKE